MFRNLDDLRSAGFSGFVSIRDLRKCKLQCVPGAPGVYVVLRVKKEVPVFLKKSTGGYFKGRDPNIDAAVLVANWRNGTPVVYIGKA